MTTPPPLPPSRGNRQRMESYVNSRDGPPSSAPSGRPTFSPRHSWAPGVAASLGPLPPLPPGADQDLPPAAPPPLPSPRRTVSPGSPPPLPPFRPTSQQPNLANIKGANLLDSVTLFPGEDEQMTLTELVDNYSSLFPLKVRVVKGFYGDRGEDCAIAVDELYHFHFVKRSKVVAIFDCGGNKYIIPLNSATKFGLMYTHSTQTFSTVEDIMNAKPMPHVVCATANYVGNSEDSSVARNEVLVVKGLEKGARIRRRPDKLKVFSITKAVEKSLTKDVCGKFTADPYKTQMYLPEFLKHIPDPIPSKAKLYLDFESDEPLPEFLTSEAITMKRLFVETSIIATPLDEEELVKGETSEDRQTVDIPITLDIEISVIPPADEKDDDYEKLTYDTMNLLAHFDPSNTTKHHVEVATDDDYSYTTQSQFFKTVRKGFEKEGLNIETPKKVRTLSHITKGTVSSPPEDETFDSEGYEDVDELNLGTVSNLGRLKEAPPSPHQSSLRSRDLPAPTPTSAGSKSTYDVPPSTPPPTPPSLRKKTQDAVKNAQNAQQEHSTVAKTLSLPPRSVARPSSATAKVELTKQVSEPAPAPAAPPAISKKPALRSKPRTRSQNSPLPDIEERVTADAPGSKERADSRSSQTESLQLVVQDLAARLDSLEKQPPSDDSSQKLKELIPKLDKAVSMTEKMEGEMRKMQQEIERLSKEVSSQATGSKPAGTNPAGVAELEALDCTQVLKMLDLMSMAKYQQSFREADIDGKILALCDDKILEEELSVTSRLDRIKLVQVISGRRSVNTIFQKAYVAFEPAPIGSQ